MAYKLVGYYENWSQYRPEGKGKFLPDQIDPSLLTHINFAFGFFGFITKSVDPKNPRLTGNYKIEPVEWNDQTVLYPALQKLKQKNPNLKTLLSIGGWSFNDPQDTNGIGTFTYKLFSQMASSAAGRKEFIDSAIAYAHKYGFDGIDLDWEYPGDRARGGTDSDFDNFLALLKEFRSAINNDGQKLLLTIASPAIKKGEAKTSEQFFAWLAQCAESLDWLNVMTYDYHGAFPDDKVTGVNAPLLQDSTPGGTFSVRHTVEAYLNGGIPKEKMVLGMPTYGRTFKVTSPLTDTDNGPGKPYSGPGGAGKATQTPGFLAYYEILERLSSGDLKRGWDRSTLTPYAYNSKTGEWVSYDDAESLAYKVSYLIEKDLAGAMVWAIDDDYFFNTGSLKQEKVSRALFLDPIEIVSLLVVILAILLHPEKRPLLPGGWSDDKELPYGTSGTPAIAAYNGLLYCVHEAKHEEGWLWYTSFDGNQWHGDTKLPYGTSGPPAVAAYKNKLYCVHEGRQEDGWLWYTSFDGNQWSGDTKLPNHGTSHGQYRRRIPSAALAVYDGLLYCVHQGQEQEQFGKLWYATFNGDTWSEDRELPNHGTFGGPALAVYNGLLYCVHEGQPKAILNPDNNASEDRDMWLWYTTFDGNTWSEDRKLPDHGTSGPPGLAVYNGKLYCIHEGRYEDGWLWYTTFDGHTWSKDTKLPYGTSRPPALAVYKGKLYCVHEGQGEKGSIWWTVLSLPNSNLDWIEARGANSYVYCKLDNLDTQGQRIEIEKTVSVDAGAPFLYAVLIKNEDSVDFPDRAMLTIQAPNGTVYDRESEQENLLVMMSGSSLRSLVVKDPIPGDYLIKLIVPAGVSFHFEIETIPFQNVFDTITDTLSTVYPQESQQLQKRDLSTNLSLELSITLGWSAVATIKLLVDRASSPTGKNRIVVGDLVRAVIGGINIKVSLQINAVQSGAQQLGRIASETSRQRQQEWRLLNLLTWNMQGANWNDGATSPWTFISRWFNDSNFSTLNLGVCCLQESGSPPAGSARLEIANIGEIQGLNLYTWRAGSRRLVEDLYILFYHWDTGGQRVNLAIVSRLFPSDIRYIPRLNARLRPLIGISLVLQNAQGQPETRWYFTIHASSRGGGDAAHLVQQVQESINQSWIVAGDFNQNPATLRDRLQLRATICPPSEATHPARNPQTQLDYAVRNQNEGVIVGNVLNEQATGGTFQSDHRAVFYSLS